MSHTDRRSPDDDNPEVITAPTLFDLRTLIGGLFVLYGILLTIVGIFDSPEEIAKANGIRINLWIGLSMLVLGVLFLIWALTRPMVLERHPLNEDLGEPPPGH